MTAAEGWIVIPRWDEFQHPDAARSQVPPWIKDYTKQLSDDAYLDLSFHQRGILHGIRLEYARSTRQLRDSTVGLSRRLGQRVTRKDLQALQNAGFIDISASRPASTTASRPARPEKRREERPYARTRATPPTTTPERPYRCAGHNDACAITMKTQDELISHLENVHWLDDEALQHALKAGSPNP